MSLSFKKLSPQKTAQLNKTYGTFALAGRKKYKLIWCEWLKWEENQLWGLCDYESKKIYVTEKELKETLIHELIHAEIGESGMRCMPSWNIDLEELVCEAASRMLSQFKLTRER